MVRLEIRDSEDTVVSALDLEVTAGATVSLSGYHGSSVYELSAHDTALLVRFTGVTKVSTAENEPEIEPEEGENPAEAYQRVHAEKIAKPQKAEKAEKVEKAKS